jgi:fibronectin type 3 domain-containing protein
MSVLREAPFDLELGTLIQVSITATNDKGISDTSPLNIVGAIVQNIPQAAPVPSRGELTDATNIEVVWSQTSTGINQGYAAVTGYKIYWDDSGDFALRVSLGSATTTTYSEAGVVQGSPYKFKISAVNVYGEGPLSDPVEITPAAVPTAPVTITMTTSNADQISLTWIESYDGGLPVTEFRVYWDQGAPDAVNYIASTPFTVYKNTYTKTTQI